MFLPHMRSYTHLPDIPNDRQHPFVQWRLEQRLEGIYPLETNCMGVYLKIFLKDSLNQENKELRQRIAS